MARRRSRAVDKIVGPGNAYVAAAKREVFGQVGIDSIAGPSEILVVADGANNPDWIAADLLSQAEHDASSQSILITDDADFADEVEAAVATRAWNCCRASEIAGASWRDFGAIIVVAKLDDAAPLVDRIAPEHLEIATDDPQSDCSRACGMRARSSSAATRPKRWAITSPAPTMCCRPRARRGSRRGCRCSIS